MGASIVHVVLYNDFISSLKKKIKSSTSTLVGGRESCTVVVGSTSCSTFFYDLFFSLEAENKSFNLVHPRPPVLLVTGGRIPPDPPSSSVATAVGGVGVIGGATSPKPPPFCLQPSAGVQVLKDLGYWGTLSPKPPAGLL